MTASPAPRTSMTRETTGRVVGGLFISAFFLYGGGSFLVFSSTGGDAALPENAGPLWLLCAGAVLFVLNSVAVVTIGVLAFRVLRPEHSRTARVYLATRTVEAVLLALAPLGTLMLALFATGSAETSNVTDSGPSDLARTLVENGDTAYWVAMATLGIGSIPFCWVLLRSHLLPRLLAVWGIAGYAIFALGSVLELSGFGVGLAMSVPGGFFEVAAGFYLLKKGFRWLTPYGALSPEDTPSTTTTPPVSPALATSTQPSDAR